MEEKEIQEVTDNAVKEVETLISATSLDATVEGYKETQIINCKDTELFIKSTIVDNVAVGYSPEELTYDWTYSEDGELFEEYDTVVANSSVKYLFFDNNEKGSNLEISFSCDKEIELSELLEILPRDRRRKDAYDKLVKFLAEEMNVQLTIKSRNYGNRKNN